MTIDPTIYDAILLFFGLGLPFILQLIKNALKWSGWKMTIVNYLVCAIASTVVLALKQVPIWPAVLLYTTVIFFETTISYGAFAKKAIPNLKE